MTEEERERLEIRPTKCRWCATPLKPWMLRGPKRLYCDARCKKKQAEWRRQQDRQYPGLSRSEVGRLNVSKRWEERLR